jgi:hypothetical protein
VFSTILLFSARAAVESWTRIPENDSQSRRGDNFTGKNTRRTGALIARSPASHDLIQHPTILEVTGKLLHRGQSYRLHLTQTIAIGPGSPAQSTHRDEWAFDFFEFPSDHHVQCNMIWAMTDFTEENGATRLIPGSQADPDGPRPFNRQERARRNDERVMPAVHRQGVSRRRCEPVRRHTRRLERHLQRRLAPPGGESVPLGATRDR